jgi:membrane-associated phospholipid phosphatase
MRSLFASELVRWWLFIFLFVTAMTLASFFWLDVPVAILCSGIFGGVRRIGDHLGSPILVTGEVLVATGAAGYRIIRGRLADLGKVTFIACAASLSVFALNEVVLKMVFGVFAPARVLYYGDLHVLHPFQGSWISSFPSGHMALAAGFVGSFIGQDRRLMALLAAGLLLASALLVLGCWHFLSDVLAGSFVGGTAGLVAATLWREHLSRQITKT